MPTFRASVVKELAASMFASSARAEWEWHMSFESVWGFDPPEAFQPEGACQSESDTDYSAEEQRRARIPAYVDSQVYELRRIYRM
jgi:hypothetical protein